MIAQGVGRTCEDHRPHPPHMIWVQAEDDVYPCDGVSGAGLPLEALWRDSFDRAYEERARKTDLPDSEWTVSGKPKQTTKKNGDPTKAAEEKPNGEDRHWWFQHGLEFSRAYVAWRESSNWQLWTTPDGQPAIELHLKVWFGDQPVQVYIDRIFITPEGELVLVDLKSGRNLPDDEGLQFGFYACALEVAYGVRPAWFTYYDARKGCITAPRKVDHITPALLGQLIKTYNRAVALRIFLPNPSRLCNHCAARKGCALVGGEDAAKYDSLLREEPQDGK